MDIDFRDDSNGAGSWNPAEVLMKLADEQAKIGGDSNETSMAEVKIRKSMPIAADVLNHIMLYSPNERLRIDAAKYVLDRGLGKAVTRDKVLSADGSEDPFEELLGLCVTDVALSDQGPAGGDITPDAT